MKIFSEANYEYVFGKPGEAGVPLRIVSYARDGAQVYSHATKMLRVVRSAYVDTKLHWFQDELAAIAQEVIRSIEEFCGEYFRTISSIQDGMPGNFNIRFKWSPPDPMFSETKIAESMDQIVKPFRRVGKSGLGLFVGQNTIKERIRFQIKLAQKRGAPLNHMLMCGPDGEGKAWLAMCVINEMQAQGTKGVVDQFTNVEFLDHIISNFGEGEIFLLEHLDRLNQRCTSQLAEYLMSTRATPLPSNGPKSPRFTLIGTTSQPNAIRAPLLASFDVRLDFAPYTPEELESIIFLLFYETVPPIDSSAVTEIIRRANGSLQSATRLMKQAREFAIVNDRSFISGDLVLNAVGISSSDSVEKDMTGVAFEIKCMNLLRRRNFEVRLTSRTSDGGIDLIAFSSDPVIGGKYVVQCKDWAGSVGAPVVRDLYGVVHAEDANKGILITASSFTQEALNFAMGKRLELIDGAMLGYLLAE
ncbi:MAG: restriction endonuclease [Chloroflexi bacterium]|nr:restriction endonuclease [Chloroflexota bacterium]